MIQRVRNRFVEKSSRRTVGQVCLLDVTCLFDVDNGFDARSIDTNGNTQGSTHVNGEEVDALNGWWLISFMNFTGHPTDSILADLIDGTYPVGIQIIVSYRADADVCTASRAFERLQPWHAVCKLAQQM